MQTLTPTNAPGLTLTRLGYGAMQLPGPGVWGPPADRPYALAIVRRAADAGVTHFDTSAAYGPDVANALLREALSPYPAGLTIATKVGVDRAPDGAFLAAASPDQLTAQVQQNLATLGVDQLPLVYLRVGGDGLLPPGPTPFADSYAALADLRAAGLISHLGLSGCTVAQLKAAEAIAPVVAVQNRFFLFDRSSADVLSECEQRGIAFVPYFPLAAGMELPHAAQRAALQAVADRHGVSRAQVTIAWLLAHSPAILAIPGTKNPAHLEENLAAADLALDGAEVTALDGISVLID
ncbi:aldo/keto reductase [Catenulispora sp. NF23]|uniref:aldo/keto reductase n=1 Tax=Catenulispora pinistramenti TaxID=2705254 RepID=UPI001BA48190|nr:aldo/keto reductase [Catenulispora pinistramenti]MBS2540112.1 aldo/keto reductase [Catenulispora pinistramenti]